MVFDLVIRGGLVVDGTGAAGFHADVGVTNGRVTAVGAVEGSAHRVVDATDLVVAPGFIDVHTHYDAQAFWDGTLSPSPLHGVTTVVGGNCGFSIAPLMPEDADYMMRMLARVEGMPLEALEVGVPWNWRTTAEYLDCLEGTLAPNAGFMVGHSALRRAVMHEDAVGQAATAEQVQMMQQLLRDGLAAGALGFSSTWSTSHNDHHGDPVPSRHATESELLALCEVVGEFPGTSLEFIPGVGAMPLERMELMASMSTAAGRPLNWNILNVNSANRDFVEHQLQASDYAAERGGRVLALTVPDSIRPRFNFLSGVGLDILPGWGPLMGLPKDEKLAMLADPSRRAEMEQLAESAEGVLRYIGDWSAYTLLETFSPATKRFAGKTVGEVAADAGRSPWDVLADIVVADELRTVISQGDKFNDDESWRLRLEAWRDPRTLVGASDAGAHLDMLDTYSYTTTMLGEAVRKRSLLPLEEAVSYLTKAPADLYGFVDRGTIREGGWADLVVFDRHTIEPVPPSTRFDLPAGAGRIYGGATGVAHVFVAGHEVVDHGTFTEARPGHVLRAGRDTN
jgi:N-acyl-D-aspartate/D-glutamate deacylase